MMYRNGKKPVSYLLPRFLVPVLYLVLIVVSNASYSDVNVFFSQTIEQSSNFLREPEVSGLDDTAETINTTSASIQYEKDISSFQANLDYQISYLNFQNNKASDVTRNNLNTEVNWFIRKEFYSWYFSDTYTQTTINANEISNEENVQDVNEFVTGPRFEWRFNATTIELRALLSNYVFSNTDNDNTTIGSDFSLNKIIPGGMRLSLKHTARYVSFDESDDIEDYEQATLGINFQYSRGVNDFDVFLGETYYGEDSNSTGFASSSVSFKRRISRVSSIGLDYSNRISDPRSQIDANGTPINGVVQEESSTLSYAKTGSSFTFNVRLSQRNRNDDDSDDVDFSNVSEVSVSRVVGTLSEVGVSYNDTARKVQVLGVSDYVDSTYTTSLTYTRRFNNKAFLRIFASDVLAKSTDILRQYEDTRVGVSLTISR